MKYDFYWLSETIRTISIDSISYAILLVQIIYISNVKQRINNVIHPKTKILLTLIIGLNPLNLQILSLFQCKQHRLVWLIIIQSFLE